MSDTKRYYYLKLKEDFFDLPEMKVIEGMPNGYKYSNILLKMYLQSLKREGKLMVTDLIPYELNSLATVVGHDVDTVRAAISLFKDFELIKILESGAIYMTQIQNFIGKSSSEADRKRLYRSRIRDEENLLLEEGGEMPEGGEPQNEQQRCPYKEILSLFLELCPRLSKVRELTDKRKKAILVIWNKHSDLGFFRELYCKVGDSDFLSGINKTNWRADFDWLLNYNNITKVLEGKYDNKDDDPEPKDRGGKRSALDLLRERKAARGGPHDG